jgi:hypothetical protein
VALGQKILSALKIMMAEAFHDSVMTWPFSESLPQSLYPTNMDTGSITLLARQQPLCASLHQRSSFRRTSDSESSSQPMDLEPQGQARKAGGPGRATMA